MSEANFPRFSFAVENNRVEVLKRKILAPE